MDCFKMTKRKQTDTGKRTAEKAAQHLADLMERNVAGFTPKLGLGNEPVLDLDEELFRHNVAVASLVILAALLWGGKAQQQKVFHQVKPEYFWEKSFDRFLFTRISDSLAIGHNFSILNLEACIQEYGPATWNEPSSERSLQGHRFTVKQLIDLRPTPAQVQQAIELRQMWAKNKGLLKDAPLE